MHVFFWAYRREWDRIEISAYSIFKTGERRKRNNKKSINKYFSVLLLSLSQLSSSSIQAVRILSLFPHHAAACPSSPLHPASLLTTAEQGTTAQGCRDHSPNKSGYAVAEQAQQSSPHLPGSWSPLSAVLKFRHLRWGSQLCWHNRIGSGSRTWHIKNITPNTLSLPKMKGFSTR